MRICFWTPRGRIPSIKGHPSGESLAIGAAWHGALGRGDVSWISSTQELSSVPIGIQVPSQKAPGPSWHPPQSHLLRRHLELSLSQLRYPLFGALPLRPAQNGVNPRHTKMSGINRHQLLLVLSLESQTLHGTGIFTHIGVVPGGSMGRQSYGSPKHVVSGNAFW